MAKKISFLISLGALVLPNIAFAALGLTCATGVTIGTMVCHAANTALLIASGVVIILWVVTGILFLTAQGAPEKLSSAKKAVLAAVAGTVLVIVALYAMDLVGGAFGI